MWIQKRSRVYFSSTLYQYQRIFYLFSYKLRWVWLHQSNHSRGPTICHGYIAVALNFWLWCTQTTWTGDIFTWARSRLKVNSFYISYILKQYALHVCLHKIILISHAERIQKHKSDIVLEIITVQIFTSAPGPRQEQQPQQREEKKHRISHCVWKQFCLSPIENAYIISTWPHFTPKTPPYTHTIFRYAFKRGLNFNSNLIIQSSITNFGIYEILYLCW